MINVNKEPINLGKAIVTKAPESQQLLSDLCHIINQSKEQIARTINSELTTLYWHIGKRIKQEILKFERAEYGQQVILNLSLSLTSLYGKGFSKTSLLKMVQLFDCFQDIETVATLSRQLSWSHFLVVIQQDKTKRKYYS